MLAMMQGYICYTLGGAAALMGLFFLFPQLVMKGMSREEKAERAPKLKNPRAAAIAFGASALLVILGMVFKI